MARSGSKKHRDKKKKRVIPVQLRRMLKEWWNSDAILTHDIECEGCGAKHPKGSIVNWCDCGSPVAHYDPQL